MNLSNLWRRSVATLDRVSHDAQVEFTHEPWIGKGAKAAPLYDDPVTVKGLVVQGLQNFRTAQGETIVVEAVIGVPRPLAANGATGRYEPIDPRDRITLADGTVGSPVTGLAPNVVDPSTGRPFAHTIGLKQ